MQFTTKLKYTSALVAAALSVSPLYATETQSITIINSGFENGFEGWEDVEPSSVSGVANSGSKAAKLSGTSAKLLQEVVVEPNTDYTLSAFVKGTGQIGVIVDGTYHSVVGGGDKDFEKVEVSFNSKNASKVTVFAAYNDGVSRFDDFVLETNLYPTATPYDYSLFQDILDKSNLQQTDLSTCTDGDVNAYCSKSDVVKAGGYEGYSSEYFYIDQNNGYLTFEMEGNSNRTELRLTENFKTSSADIHRLAAEIALVDPLLSVSVSGEGKEITLLQIHNKGENAETDSTVLSHPLLRVVWDGESRVDDATGISHAQGYWAVVKTNAYECSDSSKDAYVADCPDSYDYYYLGDWEEEETTKFEIVTGDNQLIINVDDAEVVNLDISYWSNLYSYFKAGVYNQYDSGNSVAQFKTLTHEAEYNETDTDTDTDSDTDSTDLVAQITDTDATDTGELRYKLSEAQTEGTLKASLFYEEGGSTTAYVSLFDSANSVSSDIADIRLKSGKVYLRTEANSSFDTGFTFPEGEWFDLEVVWDTAVSNTYTIYINGEEVGTYDAENASAAVQTLAIRYNSNSGTTTETLYVDNLAIYSDQAGSVVVHEDDFDSWTAGDSLDTAPYNSATQEAVVVANPSPTVTNLVAKITDTDATDTGELRYKLATAQTEGSAKASIFYEVGGSTTAYVSLFDSANSVSSDIADIRLKSGKVYLRTEANSSFDTGATFPEGEWFDLEVTWDTAVDNTYTVLIDGVEVGTFTAENPSAAVQTVAIRFNSNSGTTTETLYVDNFAIYADQAATEVVYSDDFDTNWLEADSLDTAPYNSATAEAVVALDPTLASDTDIDTETDGDTDVETDTDGDTDSDSDGDTDSDSDTETDIETPTDTDTATDSDTETDVEPTYNQVAKIADTLDTDTGELRYKLADAQTEGTVKASLYYEVGGSITAYIGLFDSANSVNSDIADIRLKSGKVYLRTEADSQFDTGITFPEGEWFDIEVSWDTAEANTYSLIVNGVDAGSFTAENPSAAVQTLAIRFNSNSSTTTEKFYIDNLAIYADQAATSVVFADDFDASWGVGASLDTSPYNSSTSEAVVAYDPTLDIETDTDTDTDSDGDSVGVPYDYPRYQDALDDANLQQNDLSTCTGGDIDAYCSKSDVVKAGGYAGYESEYFYIDETSGWLTFEMAGDSNRTELRFVDNFLTNSADLTYSLSAEILPIDPQSSVANSADGQEMTLLQVHNKGENAATDDTVLSHPLLRVVWDGESRKDDATGLSYSNAYWAIIKTNAYECSDSSHPAYVEDCPDSYDAYYLADYDASTATQFDVTAGNNQLIVSVDGSEVVNYDISYWSHLYSYFKAGVYNQYESGNSVVQFKTLTYSIQDANEVDITDPGELDVADLDPTVAPSSNFDLSTWNLSVPIDSGASSTYAKATTIKVKDLNLGYEDEEYFWTDAKDGGMVFTAYNDGARTSENTTYTRSELREMLRGEDTSISTQGVNANNWVFSSVPVEQQEAAGGVDGYMKATLAVNAVTTTGKSSYRGRVIIGQIHAASDEPIRIYYRLLPGHSKGSIYFAHEPSNGNDEQWYEMIGSRSSSASEPEDGIQLNEKFSYEIDVQGDLMTVTITRTDGSTVVQEVDMSDSGYSDGYYDKDGDGVDETEDYMYFKAGVYNQNKLVDEDEDGIDDNGAEADDYVQATFYYLTTSHN